MSVFKVEITDLAGTVKATVTQREDTQSPVPLNDSRTAQVRIPIQHAAEVKPLERMLRIFYRQATNPDPIFWGVITDPDWKFGEGFVDVPAVDQWERLERHFARFGDTVVGASTAKHPPNSPTDYTTVRNLILAAENTAAQAAAGDPDIGIKRTGAGTFNDAVAAVGSTMQIERGANVAQKIQEIIKGSYGPDVVLYPKLSLGATPSGTPYYVALRTYDTQGIDRTASLTFRCVEPEDPAHLNNVQDASWNPQGSQVQNHHTSIVQGDAKNPGIRVQASHPQSFLKYGPRSAWDNPAGTNSKRISVKALEGHASSALERYSYPPNFITLEAKVEPSLGANPWPQWLTHFDVGDRVKVYVKKADMDFDVLFGGPITMRIVKVTPQQVDAADNARVDIEVVPHVADPSEFVVSEGS